jgi:hypothetical protein
MLKQWYVAARKLALGASLVVILACFYSGGLLGPYRSYLLPAAVVIVAVYLLDSLNRIEGHLAAQNDIGDFPDVSAAVPRLVELAGKNSKELRLEIIAATGGTTLASVLPRLVSEAGTRQVQIAMHLADPDGPLAEWFPHHWEAETRLTCSRALQMFRGRGNVSLDIRFYSHLPMLHGILLNRQHLLLGFFGWHEQPGSSPVLSGAQRPHRLYSRSEPSHQQLFAVFEDWLEQDVPTTRCVQIPEQTSVQAGEASVLQT